MMYRTIIINRETERERDGDIFTIVLIRSIRPILHYSNGFFIITEQNTLIGP